MQASNSPYRLKLVHQLFSGVTGSLPLVMVRPSLSTKLQWESVAMSSRGFSMIKGLMRKMHFHAFQLCSWNVIQVVLEGTETLLPHLLLHPMPIRLLLAEFTFKRYGPYTHFLYSFLLVEQPRIFINSFSFFFSLSFKRFLLNWLSNSIFPHRKQGRTPNKSRIRIEVLVKFQY